MLIGIDEVGRGAWAGPLLVVAAKQTSKLPVGLADSKKLTKKRRSDLIQDIKAACNLGEGWVQPGEVDEMGLSKAMKLGVERALSALGAEYEDEIIMDGSVDYCPEGFSNVRCIVRADVMHPIVSAASVYAKVTRDNHMSELAVKFPDYGFEIHVGYGTKAHNEALKSNGACVIHRRSYKPVQAYLL